MEQEEPIYKGFLLLPPVEKFLKKSWQQKYCLLFKASKFGLERLEIFDAIDSKESKIITLENCIKIQAKSATIFCITTKTRVHEFGTLSEQSLNEWLTAIQPVAFPEENLRSTGIEEDNDIYCSSGENIFYVKLHHSPASERCELENKNYTLVLTSTALQLKNIADNKLLLTWPYCSIRRYGYKIGKFTFEAGRKCESGEGTFFLEHPNQQDIFRCLASKMKCMKKLLTGESPPVSDCGDIQIQAALSMEARSGTPPSPSQLSEDISLFERKVKPTMQPKKASVLKKPTRIPGPSSDYETVGNAMGVDDPNHSEQPNDDDPQEDYMSCAQFKKADALKPHVQPLAPKVIVQGSTTDLNDSQYDKLNFFGPTSKLSAKSGYDQVLRVPIAPKPYERKDHEYDEVEYINMEPVKSADDSHLGSTLVGSKCTAEVVTDDKKEKVSHYFHNAETYATISKPKPV